MHLFLYSQQNGIILILSLGGEHHEMGRSKKNIPKQICKIQILESHMDGNVRKADDMSVIKAFNDSKEATRELVRAKDDILVYHTENENIEVVVKQIFGYRGIV